MDSLLANYASSDEEEEKHYLSEPLASKSGAEEEQSESTSTPGGFFTSLPPPKSSLFNSLPAPKSQSFPDPKPNTYYVKQDEQTDDRVLENSKPKTSSSSSLFSAIPPPKSSASASSSTTTSKKVVQFRPPPIVNPFSSSADDEDEDEEERQRKRSKASLSTSSAVSFLSSMPAPKNSATLGAIPSALGSGRRCIIESEARESTESVTGRDTVVSSNVGSVNNQSDETNYDHSSWGLGSKSTAYYSGTETFQAENVASAVMSSVMANDGGADSDLGFSKVESDELNYDYPGTISGSESYNKHHNGGQFVSVGPEAVNYSYGNEDHVDYPNYTAGYGYSSDNPQNVHNWADTSIMTAFPEASGGLETGKRGRRDAPQDIVEVKQDELMKNRPREDQTKMTGIAFGPAFQPTSSKGKPSKLHKRKHQIGSLFFDMKQKETELAERRSKGYATKSQTQAKYGCWNKDVGVESMFNEKENLEKKPVAKKLCICSDTTHAGSFRCRLHRKDPTRAGAQPLLTHHL
ncbi:hypothetical protein F511_04795 [Dorcoceras hygrometricum]|uniref:Uncharacterized protein n=1 Tax=Dorcoceras hygrometricum TaxID=472368 RepID=A0A2Z7AV22_9LAMI|nr:hypothetical protein F511_04795 [Dorcoceras hygrometricum]